MRSRSKTKGLSKNDAPKPEVAEVARVGTNHTLRLTDPRSRERERFLNVLKLILMIFFQLIHLSDYESVIMQLSDLIHPSD